MSVGAHDAGGGIGRSASTEMFKGIAVLVAVVLVGTLLMVKGLDDNEAIAAADSVSSTTEPAGTDDGTGDDDTGDGTTDDTVITTLPPEDDSGATDDTLGPPRDPAEVTVLSVNGTDPVQSGAAGRGRDIVQAANYAVASPANAVRTGPSAVFFLEGFESDARAVATLFGVDPNAVVKPYSAETAPVDDLRGAQVIVLIGNDGVISV